MQATLLKRIEQVSSEIDRLKNVVFAMQTTDISKYRLNYEELSIGAALRAERITCSLRNLVYANDVKAKQHYMKEAVAAHHIQISQENGILKIQLPGLLPKRKSRVNSAFLYEPLSFAMQEYIKSESPSLYETCVICFTQVYDRKLSLRRIRDYDNLEWKQIQDTIASFLLRDDTGSLCDAYHTTALGDSDCTVIHIMEQSIFPEWIKQQKSPPNTISENH